MKNAPEKITKLLICCCADYQRVNDDSIQQLYTAAVRAGITVELCPDLCLETIENPCFLQKICEAGTAVAACSPRAIKALFHRVKCTPPLLIDLRGQPIQKLLKSFNWEQSENLPMDLPPYNNSWKAWYPVIDSERCSHCGKCVDYCFFGVYQREEKHVEVKFPQNCKNNCPACARMCPQKAIIFPKHPDSTINGGGEDSFKDSMLIPPGKMFDENLYNRLAQRRRDQRKSALFKE